MKTITIIGTGNVAFHLASAMVSVGLSIDAVYGRNQKKTREFAKLFQTKVTDKLETITSDLVVICVTDDALIEVINQLPKSVNIAYTSGAIPLQTLTQDRPIGVLYPLQSFSKNSSLNYPNIPFLIEGNSAEIEKEIYILARKLSNKVEIVSSEDRKKYHLAAVWVNNFTNHILYQAKTLIDKENLHWEFLLPLLAETVDKLNTLDPFDAQTGPARRHDKNTIAAHEKMQEGIQKELYQLLTKSINETYSQPHDKL
jgi:predicted short-subunit dehydrogenase-like oxidoreductase (DUF2520 family)